MTTQVNTTNQVNAPRPAPEAEEVYRRWLSFLDEEFTRHQSPERRGEIVRDQLYQLYLGRPHGGKLNLNLTSELPGNVVSLALDPQNITLEAQHFCDVNHEEYEKRKPLLWFWQMFDRSPVGLNHWLGLRFRCMLGRHLFARVGTGVRIFHGVELIYGYNLRIGNNVTIRHSVLLHDRGGITIGDNAIVGTYSRIYSHTSAHDDHDKPSLQPTEIGAEARIGAHSIVLGGSKIPAGQIVGEYPVSRN